MSNKPLKGIKVIEMATYVAGPSAGRILSEFGAEVIKIESPSGDPWRMSGKNMLHTTDDENPVFDVYNSGKKSVCINIKNEKEKNALLNLISTADIFLTNTREKSLKKYELDSENLRKRFPSLIYASVDGYGKKGPDCDKPGFDNISFWARSGFALDAPIKTDNSYPLPVLSGIGDCVTGGFLVAGITSALYEREKTKTGSTINLSLYGTAIWVMSSMILRSVPKYGEEFPKSEIQGDALTYTYECKDGKWVNIGVRQYDKDAPLMFDILGIKEEIEKLVTVNAKTYYSMDTILIPIIRKAFLSKPSTYWVEKFTEKDLVIGVLPHFKDVLTDPQALENGFIGELTNRNGTKTLIPCQPIQIDDEVNNKVNYSESLGESTNKIINRP